MVQMPDRCFMVVVKASPNVIGTVTFLVHTKLLGYPLTAAAGFTALALFNQLRMPLIVLPDTLNYYIQVSVDRCFCFRCRRFCFVILLLLPFAVVGGAVVVAAVATCLCSCCRLRCLCRRRCGCWCRGC